MLAVPSGPAIAQVALPLLVDCGDLNGFPVGEPGYELLTETSAPTGVVLNPAPLDTVHVRGSYPLFGGVVWPADVMSIDPDQLGELHRFTSLQLASGTVFSLAGLPSDTPHRVRLELGAMFPWVDLEDFNWVAKDSASIGVSVDVETPLQAGTTWTAAARDLRCTTSYAPATFASNVGSLITVWVKAWSDEGGTLRLRLRSSGGEPVFLTSVQVHRHEVLPVHYRRGPAGALVASLGAVQPFVDLFNAGAYDLAQDWAQGQPDGWLRGVCLAHLAGWLDGSRDGRWHLLGDAANALASVAAQHPGAAWLLDEIALARRALDHLAARGHVWAAACPDAGGYGFMNPDCGPDLSFSPLGQSVSNANAYVGMRLLSGLVAARSGTTVLADLVEWNAGTLPETHWEPSPLVFAALKTWGAIIPWVNPLLAVQPADPESQAMLDSFRAVFADFVDLGFHAADFPGEHELLLFDAYAQAGVHPKDWDSAQVDSLFTDAQLQQAWWADLVAAPAEDPAAPDWANLQRDLRAMHTAAVEYWVRERLVNGELGGGPGDDIELLLQLFPTFAARLDQLDQRNRDALADIIEAVLFELDLVQDGYFAGEITDVQHAAEFTTDPFLVERGVFGWTPLATEIALGVGRRLRYEPDPALAWTGLTVLGRRRFRSNWFSAQGVSEDPAKSVDILLNGRATFPAVALSLRGLLPSSHPCVADLAEWSLAVREDALMPANQAHGKPLGFPTHVQFPSNDIGVSGVWYSANGTVGDTGLYLGGHTSYALEVLRAGYEQSTAPDRWRFLLPAVRMFRSVTEWQAAGGPPGSAGGKNWTASLYHDDARFGSSVVQMLGALQADGHLTTALDPALGLTTTYVDQELLDAMRAWIEVEFVNQNNAVRYAFQDVDPCGAGHSAKGTQSLSNPFGKASVFHRHCWPLITTHAYHTDRVFLNVYEGVNTILAAHSGHAQREGLVQRSLLAWRRNDGKALDAAVLVNQRDAGGTTVSAFVHLFEDVPTPVQLQLSDGLQPALYLVEWAPAEFTCDVFPAGADVSVTQVQKRGAGAQVALELPPGLNLVRLTPLGPPDTPAPAWDLAVDRPRLLVDLAASPPDLVVRVSVANLGPVPSPAAILDLKGAVLLPNSQLLPIPGLGTEVSLTQLSVPALPGLTDWTLLRHEVELRIPIDGAITAVFVAGLGVQLRATVGTGGDDADVLNDAQARGVFHRDLEVWTPLEGPGGPDPGGPDPGGQDPGSQDPDR